jgi:hypothetical protein
MATVGRVRRVRAIAHGSQGITVVDIGKYQVRPLDLPGTEAAGARRGAEACQVVAAATDPPQLHAGPGATRDGAQDEDIGGPGDAHQLAGHETGRWLGGGTAPGEESQGRSQ